MTVVLAPSVPVARPPASTLEQPIALLQLDGAHIADAATAIYAEVRRGRRVVSVVAGDDQATERLADRLKAIGVIVSRPDHGAALLDAPVALLRGPSRPKRSSDVAAAPVVRVALAGCGVVGGGVMARLLEDPRFDLVGVLVRDPNKPRDTPIPPELVVTDPATLIAREPDVLIDALSDAWTGLSLLRAALTRGVDAISAGKQAVGADLPGLSALARSSGAALRYSACVGGGTPMIETVRLARTQGAIVRIEAVLNGTCNFILNRLAAGADFDDAVTQAQAAGFAEADPTADLSGLDAAAKLSILAHEAGLTAPPHAIRRQGLEHAPAGGLWRQVARLERGGQAEVVLEAVDPHNEFGTLSDEWNALRIVLEDGRVITTRGRGAGRAPTVESVWADLIEGLAARE